MSAACVASETQRAIDWLGGFAEGQMTEASSEQLLGLCGSWLDQKGSVYQLLPASARSLHVYTIRPSGHRRYTANLVRLVTKRGELRVIWGTHRYTLSHDGQDSIRWQGRSVGDHYDWTRIA